jgi:hypothetical protein
MEATAVKPTYEELQQQLEALQKKQTRGFELKVSDKGGVSIYFGTRFPTTLYYEQWITVIENIDDIAAFLEENKSKLKMKK